MATKKKLNTKFLAIVLGSLAVGLAVVGGIVLVQYRNDPVKHIRSGDELMAEGRPDKAAQQYLRGVGKAPFEMAYYDKAIEAIEAIRPQTDFEAMEEFNRLVTVLIAKAEKASPQDGRSAREVRAETLGRVLDEIRIFVWGREATELTVRDRAYSDLARRFQLVDNALRRVPPADRDDRIAAVVRGVTLEAAWRAGLLQTDSQWEDSQKKLREAIKLDPTYVPNWYGLLRGQLDRVARTLAESGPSSARRLLEGEGGFLETLAEARTALASVPAPELDLLEIELGQVALYAGLSGTEEGDIAADPDLAALAQVIEGIAEIESLAEWEARWRLEELRASGASLIRRAPSARLDIGDRTDWRDAGIRLVDAATDAIVAIDPEDGRATLLTLRRLSFSDSTSTADEEWIQGTLDAAAERTRGTVGLDAIVVPNIRRVAARARFDLALGRAIEKFRNETELSPEDVEALKEGLAAVEAAHADDVGDVESTEVLQCRLMYAAYLGVEAGRRNDKDAANAFFRDGSRAASKLRESTDAVLDGRTLDAALFVAEARGEFGEALQLYERAVAANPEVAEDLAIRFRFVNLLVNAARLDDAARLLPEIEARAVAEGDKLTLARLEKLADRIRVVDQGAELDDLKGADLLAAETEAALRGDLDERRRLLDEVIEDPEVLAQIRAKALLRRASIEATEGDFAIARQYAERVLELEPDNAMAKLIMQADADTGLIDRFRLLAENATEDPEDRDVAVAALIRNQLVADATAILGEREALEAEYERLLVSLRANPEPGVDALRFLAEIELADGRVAEAEALLERLAIVETQPSSPSVLLRARVFEAAGRLEDAIELVQDAIQSQGLGSDGMYVVLGDLLSSRGERAAAREAYQTAFKLAPTRPVNAMRLASQLLAEGRADEALPVLRAARNAGRDSTNYLDRWLIQEMRSGNHGVAIRERRRRYVFAPTDFRNASALVVLLMESPIGRDDVVWTEEDIRATGQRGVSPGDPLDETVWSRLTPAARQRAVAAVKQMRVREAGEIIERMRALDDSDPQVVVAATGFLRASDPEGGAAAARDLVATTVSDVRERLAQMSDDEARPVLELRLARLLTLQGDLALQARDLEAAAMLFQEAADLEGDRSSDVDTVVASTYQRQGMLAESVPFQARLLEERERANTPLALRRDIARRLVELYVATDDLEGAAPIVDRYFRTEDPTVPDLVSLAAFTFGRADEARRNRKSLEDDAYLALLDEAMALYDRAIELRADDYTIDFTRAKIAEYRWRWANDEDRGRLYTELRKLVGQIAARRSDNWAARRNLVEVLLYADAGDPAVEESADDRFKQAMAEIRAYLEIDPSENEARKLLIDSITVRAEQMRAASFEADKVNEQFEIALDVAQAALDADPSNRDWSARVGRIRTELRQFDDAAAQFGLLFQQTGDPSFLQMQTMALMERTPPAADAVIDLARANGGLFARQPFLAGMYAAAMAQTGRRDLALRNFEATYREVARSASAAGVKPEDGWRSRGFISASMPRLFPKTEDGVRDLEVFIDTISDGKPGLSDLLALGAAWQTVLDVAEASTPVDEALVERARRAAADVMRRATVAEPEHPETFVAFLRLGLLLQRLDDCDGSVEAFERCVALKSDSPEAKNNLAYLLRECDRDLDRALELVVDAVAGRPASPEFRDTHGAILLELAARTEDAEQRTALRQQARDELNQAARLGRSPAPLIRLAELEIEEGRPEAARTALLRADERNPNEAQVARIQALVALLGTAE